MRAARVCAALSFAIQLACGNGTDAGGPRGSAGNGASGGMSGGTAGVAGSTSGAAGSAAGTAGGGGPPSGGQSGSSGATMGGASSGGGGSDSGQGGAPAIVTKVVGGYYPNWTEAPVRLRDVDPHYNLIYLFAATPVGGPPGTTGAVTFDLPGDGRGAASNFKEDIAFARESQKRRIILSVGGAKQGMSFPSREKSQTFLDSIAALYEQFGPFDGLDWNTFEADQDPDTDEMIWISLQLKQRYSGFSISAPPAPWNERDKTFCAAMVAAGALDYAAPQYYDGPGLATQEYVTKSVAEWATLLGADKVAVGYGIASAENYMSIEDAVSTWQAVSVANPGLRGAFDWEIHSDEEQGWSFAKQLGPLIVP